MRTGARTEVFAQRATLARSVGLLRQFRYEQRDPARFYGALAADTAAMVTDLWGAQPSGTLLDVGGGPGYFASAFTAAGWHYIGVEPDPREMHAAGRVSHGVPGAFVPQRESLQAPRAYAAGANIGRWLYVAGGSTDGGTAWIDVRNLSSLPCFGWANSTGARSSKGL